MRDLTLAATSTAATCAKLFVDSTLRRWGHLKLTDAAEQLATELVADAVHLTGLSDPHIRWTELEDLALLRVRLVLLDHGIICEIADRHRQPPAPSEQLQAICQRWGSYLTRTGRVVWGELGPLARELTDHGLPRRTPSPVPSVTQPGEYLVDEEILRRVRKGLGELG
jgi:hypothetical protein